MIEYIVSFAILLGLMLYLKMTHKTNKDWRSIIEH